MKTYCLEIVKILILSFIGFSVSGCSYLGSYIYFDQNNSANKWKERTDFKVWDNSQYPGYSHKFYYCDDTNSFAIIFKDDFHDWTIGPVLLPIFPIFLLRNYHPEYRVVLIIKSENDQQLPNLINNIKFCINDSMNVIKPKIERIDTNICSYENLVEPSCCSDSFDNRSRSYNHSPKFLYYKKSIIIELLFNILPDDIKYIYISFNEDFKKEFKLNLTDLTFIKSRKIYYIPYTTDNFH
jgi:hypothetical protein